MDIRYEQKYKLNWKRAAFDIITMTATAVKWTIKFAWKLLLIVLDVALSISAKPAVLAVRDLTRKKSKVSFKVNMLRIAVSVVMLSATVFGIVKATQFTYSVTAAPVITQAQKLTAVKHVEALKNKKIVATPQQPVDTNVEEINALPGSPLANEQLQSKSYQNGKLKVVKTLFANPQNDDERFLNQVAVPAQQAALSYGVNPSVLIAQSYIESGAGKSLLASKYNNYFGIKYRGTGNSVTLKTQEDDGKGNLYTINAPFQVYGSIAEGMADNAKLLRYGIKGQPDRYKGTWVENTHSYQDATKALTGTYATDTHYNTTLDTFINAYGLSVLDVH